jgi:hypothetical protein
MKRRLVLIPLFILLAAWLAAYAPFHAIAHEPPRDYASFITDLTAAGGIVETDGEISQPIFAVKGHRITVNGSDVQIFEFPSHTKATAEAARISPDGYSIGTTQVDWIAKPHFYNSGKLIILYVGENAVIERLLESVVGSQFAGK